MKKTLLLTIFAGLTGCASAPPAPSGPDLVQVVGERFAGRPVTEMAAYYGAPDQQQQFQGETVYSWRKNVNRSYGDRPPVPLSCKLDAYVRADGVVRTVGFSGQAGACETMGP